MGCCMSRNANADAAAWNTAPLKGTAREVVFPYTNAQMKQKRRDGTTDTFVTSRAEIGRRLQLNCI